MLLLLLWYSGAGAAFQDLANSVRSLSESVQGISMNMEQQAAAIADVVGTMDELDHVSSREGADEVV